MSLDELGRKALAKSIYGLIGTTKRRGALRIGVYGGWGEGKTTLLEFIRQLCETDGHRVAWFSPWDSETRLQLWVSFYGSILEALHAESKSSWLFRKALPAAARLSELHKATKEASESLLSLALIQLQEKIRQQLKKLEDPSKLIVIIDDLDRASPELVPHLLLGILEVFNMERCVYIIGLDPNIIARALPKVHPGWGTTTEFLEKILELRFWLPSPKHSNLFKLAEHELQTLPFKVDRATLVDMLDLLPTNPRKLKQFLNGLLRLRIQLERHRDNAIQWALLLFLEIIRSHSFQVFEKLILAEDFWNELQLSSFRAKSPTLTTPEVGIGEEKWVGLLKSILLGTLNKEDSDRYLPELIRLLGAFRDRTSFATYENIKYWGNLCEQPPVFTWKEFDDFLKEWDKTASRVTLENLVRNHAGVIGMPESAVYEDLIKTATQFDNLCLERAANSNLEGQVLEYLKEAESVMGVLRVLIYDIGVFKGNTPIVSTPSFKVICDHFSRWAHFLNLPEYVNRRNVEKDLLIKAAADGVSFAEPMLELLKIYDTLIARVEGSGESLALRVAVAEVFAKPVCSILLQRFERADGIASLWPNDKSWPEKYLLLRRDSEFYSEERIEKLRLLATRAKRESAIQDNFLQYLLLIGQGLNRKLTWVSREDSISLAKDREIIAFTWKAATSSPFQPRTVSTLKEVREIIASVADGNDHMPLPEWLK